MLLLLSRVRDVLLYPLCGGKKQNISKTGSDDQIIYGTEQCCILCLLTLNLLNSSNCLRGSIALSGPLCRSMMSLSGFLVGKLVDNESNGFIGEKSTWRSGPLSDFKLQRQETPLRGEPRAEPTMNSSLTTAVCPCDIPVSRVSMERYQSTIEEETEGVKERKRLEGG